MAVTMVLVPAPAPEPEPDRLFDWATPVGDYLMHAFPTDASPARSACDEWWSHDVEPFDPTGAFCRRCLAAVFRAIEHRAIVARVLAS